jgi:gluconokinase
MTDQPLALTLDIGTSSTRALLWDTAGREVEGVGAQTPYQMHTTDDGGVEMEAEALFTHVGACLDQALGQAGDRAKAIRAVGMSTYWHALLGLDGNGAPLTPVYSWADTRSAAVARRLRADLDAHAIHARTGCVIHPSYYPAKLVWLRETRPDLFSRVARWVSPSEYLFGRLFGAEARRVSISMASGTGLFHQEHCVWDTETLAALQIPIETLSPIVDLKQSFQGLQGDLVGRWPTLQDVPFFPAVGDGACGNVGSGCVSPERFAINLGTSGAIRTVWEEKAEGRGKREEGREGREKTNSDSPSPAERSEGMRGVAGRGSNRFEPSPCSGAGGEGPFSIENRKSKIENPPGLWRYRIDARRPIMGAAFSDGGHVYAWMARTLQLPPAEALEQQIAAMEPGAHGMIFLPFLAGERSMGWNPDARASLVGMNLDTSPVEIVRAAMEAVALRFALAAQALRGVFPQAREIVASGGALGHSPAWTQIFADALGKPVIMAAEAEASSRGAGLLAMEAAGLIDRTEEAQARLGRAFLPDEARHARYVEMLTHQQHLYDLLVSG